jgi:MiaB/RimO family radical SAM methylthiotransferase
MNAKRIYISSNGCPGRDLDMSRLIRYFEINDCRMVSSAKKADYIIFVTCSFKENRKNASIENIRKYKTYKGELIVAGCLPEIAPEELSEIFSGKCISTKQLEQIDNFFPDFRYKFNMVEDAHYLYPKLSYIFQKALPEIKLNKNLYKQFTSLKIFSEGKQIPYLRIGRGCNEKCAYCGIRKAIGPLKSKSIQELKNEYASLLNKGYRKFKLFSDNVGAYGADIGSSLSDLLNELAGVHHNENGTGKDHGIEWYLLHLYPLWAVQNQDEIIKRIEEKTITQIMFPIQSGSERILKLMNRYDNNNEVLKTLSAFKAANSKLKLYSQVIIGFPSETEEDFMDTVRFIKDVKFDLVIPFEYYDSPHTLSSKMTQKVDNNIILDRMKQFGQMLDKEGMKWLTL